MSTSIWNSTSCCGKVFDERLNPYTLGCHSYVFIFPFSLHTEITNKKILLSMPVLRSGEMFCFNQDIIIDIQHEYAGTV